MKKINNSQRLQGHLRRQGAPAAAAEHLHSARQQAPLRNPGKVSLELIEVQSGSYLGEDDIVRYDDVYGRA